jgi:ATP-dependent DNA helicase RecG
VAHQVSLTDFDARMTRAEFWNLVGTVEHERLDFKRGVPDDVKDTIPAMAMTDGGLLILGVRDSDREIVGCPLSQNTLDRITRYSNECNVEVQVIEVVIESKSVTIVGVPEIRGRIVTTPDGRLLRRVGGDCQPLVGDALARFVREREDRSAEEETLVAFDVVDIDLEEVNAALKADGRRAVRRDAAPRALVDLGVANPSAPPLGPQLLRAGAVLFATDPTKYVPGATMQLVRREGVGPGPGPSSAREECRGPLAKVLAAAMQFIATHTQQWEVVTGTRRERLPEYPEAVLREALLNALAHRDYGLSGATVDVTIWDDRIEIRSPGSLPGHITPDNMLAEHYSRNRRIMRVLKTVGLVEEYGDGVDRMIREMEERLMEPPFFAATPNSVTVVLRNRFVVDVEDQVWLSLLGQYQLSTAERRALVIARREGAVTPRAIRSVMPDVDVDALLAGSIAKGLLVRIGEKGGARYVLADEVVLRAGGAGLEAQSRKRQLLLDEIRSRGSLSTAEGAALLSEDLVTVRHRLNDLTNAGLIRAHGNTRGRRYHPA